MKSTSKTYTLINANVGLYLFNGAYKVLERSMRMITISYVVKEKDNNSVEVKREVYEEDSTVNEKVSVTTLIDTFQEALEKKQKTRKKKGN